MGMGTPGPTPGGNVRLDLAPRLPGASVHALSPLRSVRLVSVLCALGLLLSLPGCTTAPKPFLFRAVSDFGGVWGTSPTDVYAVGSDGRILHHDGAAWTAEPSGTTAILTDVWGTAADDVYAVGDAGAILHYDGTRWASMASNTTNALQGIWGSSAHDIHAVGYEGTILHYDGQRWSAVDWKAPIDWTRKF